MREIEFVGEEVALPIVTKKPLRLKMINEVFRALIMCQVPFSILDMINST